MNELRRALSVMGSPLRLKDRLCSNIRNLSQRQQSPGFGDKAIDMYEADFGIRGHSPKIDDHVVAQAKQLPACPAL